MKGESKLKILLRGQRSTLDKEHKADLENNRGAVWIHAASVGEFEQARPLIEKLKEERLKIVVTFFSPSGYEARKNYDLADGVYYLPLATRRNARKFLEALQPRMAIFVKYEFWPAYLKELKKRNIPTYSISAIFRPTQRFFHWYGRSSLRLLKCFTHIYVQDEASRRLLAEHGVHDCSVTGDTRFDRVAQVMQERMNEPMNERLAPVAEFAQGCERVIVAGSTWPQDEELLVRFVERVNEYTNERTKLILVPHELKVNGTGEMNAESRRNILQRANVLLIDTMGLLSSIYRFGQVAYIGGGFGVGIHNTIEAAVYGVPVVFGPNYHHFREAQGLIDAGAARSIKNYNELAQALTLALAQHQTIGAKAAEYVKSELGATQKIYEQII